MWAAARKLCDVAGDAAAADGNAAADRGLADADVTDGKMPDYAVEDAEADDDYDDDDDADDDDDGDDDAADDDADDDADADVDADADAADDDADDDAGDDDGWWWMMMLSMLMFRMMAGSCSCGWCTRKPSSKRRPYFGNLGLCDFRTLADCQRSACQKDPVAMSTTDAFQFILHCNHCRCRQKVGTHLKSDNLVPAWLFRNALGPPFNPFTHLSGVALSMVTPQHMEAKQLRA